VTDEPRQPTEEELRAALEEQMKKITVKDVLLQTVITLINVSARKLGLAGEETEKDLVEAQKGIDAVRALVPLLPAEEQTAVREPLSQLQMVYAREAGAGGQRTADSGQEEAPASPADDEREKARSKIWTPPGT
jgi:hypothetical protein